MSLNRLLRADDGASAATIAKLLCVSPPTAAAAASAAVAASSSLSAFGEWGADDASSASADCARARGCAYQRQNGECLRARGRAGATHNQLVSSDRTLRRQLAKIGLIIECVEKEDRGTDEICYNNFDDKTSAAVARRMNDFDADARAVRRVDNILKRRCCRVAPLVPLHSHRRHRRRRRHRRLPTCIGDLGQRACKL